jgi:hypothetical protein
MKLRVTVVKVNFEWMKIILEIEKTFIIENIYLEIEKTFFYYWKYLFRNWENIFFIIENIYLEII